MTIALMFAGFATVLTPIALALHARGLQRLYWFLLLLPLYYCLISAAAWAALIDLFTRPYEWIKTEHGLARPSTRASRNIGN